ncbi:UvrD-helicase domain-containing protein [Limosilactobacillus reuteri]|jgi:superfamily I DNA/RNA helicase|uniref:UvrD-helicase domain-containing protein n=1 Tax=Limosilactobacillus reuteri TaxID=1598 RepID=UPI001C3FAB02|nr:UvrD-helicase domain-containing protein [Limosilactobacillus reuteri]
MSVVLPRLVGEQCRILYLPENSNQVILGVAGSGKSVEAAYRAIWISLGHPSDNILVLTVNKEVNNQLRAMIDSYNHNSNIEVSTIYTYFKNLMNKYYPKNGAFHQWLHDHRVSNGVQDDGKLIATTSKEDEEIFATLIEESKEEYADSTLWDKDNAEDFIKDEINWMQRNSIESGNQYLEVSRIGRGNQRISSQQRIVMFKIFKRYYELREELTGKAFSYYDIYRFVAKYCKIPEDVKPKYIIIDEVQDISPAMFAGLRSIIKDDGLWTVFGDTSQNIFGERISWSTLGLDNIRKRYYLYRNYRNTREIGELAKSMLDTDLFQKDDDTFLEPSLSAFRGEQPILWHINNENKGFIVEQVKKHIDDGTVAIILMNPRVERPALKQILEENDIEYVNDLNKMTKETIFMDSINRVKGLEFDTVIVVCIDDIQESLSPKASSNGQLNMELSLEDQEIIAKTVYVAATRARKNLILAYRDNPLKFLINNHDYVREVGD